MLSSHGHRGCPQVEDSWLRRSDPIVHRLFADARVDRMRQVLEAIDDNNEKVAYLRSCVIGELVSECANVFVAHEDDILEGRFDGCLIDHISQRLRVGYENCSKVAWAKIYNSSDVVDIELAGNRIITFLLDRLIDAVLHPEKIIRGCC